MLRNSKILGLKQIFLKMAIQQKIDFYARILEQNAKEKKYKKLCKFSRDNHDISLRDSFFARTHDYFPFLSDCNKNIDSQDNSRFYVCS